MQVPDPFLKNVLLRASYKVFEEAKKQNITLGFKDLGAGGIMCVTSELCAAGNVGCIVDLDVVPTSMDGLPSFIIACSETQERFCWVSPASFTSTILKIYNEEYDLSSISEGAQATVIGKVTEEQQYIITHNGTKVCDAPVQQVTAGIQYIRPSKQPEITISKDIVPEIVDYNQLLLNVLAHPNVCNKSAIYHHYDRHVLANTIIQAGDADAGLIAPLPGSSAGVALTVDSNPRYTKLNPALGSKHTVYEAMRNIISIGAKPIGMTDCLNFGNPENPEQFWIFEQCVKAIGEAAKELSLDQYPIPFVSGNVSFYNQSATGKAIDPSPIISCVGVMQDYSGAITMQIKRSDSLLCLIGQRTASLGGSVLLDLYSQLGATLPLINNDIVIKQMRAVLAIIDKRLALASHDISDGGLLTTISEMLMGGNGAGKFGAIIQFDDKLHAAALLFGETPGHILEIPRHYFNEATEICKQLGVDLFTIGETTKESTLLVSCNSTELIYLPLEQMKAAWMQSLQELLK